MRFSLNSRCSNEYLQQADEIKVEWRDRTTIPDLAIKYPNKDILLEFIPSQIQDNIPDENELKQYNIICQGHFICGCNDISFCELCKELNIRFYYGYFINTYYELRQLIEMGVEYVRLGPGLFFNLPKVKEQNIKIRMVPNVAFADRFPHANGIHGLWVAPEDTENYSKYVDIFEFEDCGRTKEEALYRIYSKGKFDGDMNDLITNLNASALSRMLPYDIGLTRMECGHACQIGRCRYCDRAFDLAHIKTIEKVEEANGERK